MTKLRESISNRKSTILRTLLTGGAFILGFIVLTVIGIQAWEFSNSTWFCTNVCHMVHPEEPTSYADSYHARVKCVECHMGRQGVLETIAIKSTHAIHLLTTPLGLYERPIEAATMRPANESCELCHWPTAFHGDTVLEIKHFQQDEANTELRTYLILKTGGGDRSRGLGRGIHWHIENKVEYIAADDHRQDIRWVRATLPDGRTVEYNDVTDPLSAEEIAKAEKRVMECADCHNRMGHPFPSPSRAVDKALAEGRLTSALPYARRELVTLLGASYPNRTTALEAADSLMARYEASYPEVAVTYAADIQRATELAKEFLDLLVFEEPGVTWRSFPDENRHKEFPGCFRCHDGKHLSSEQESIRLHCNICHSIPITVGPGARAPDMPVATISEPPSHLETNFIADHRFQANGDCVSCHGQVTFGSDDSNFCSNSACHGQAWPSVELDAAFPHPIPLEGRHAEVWCHDCHEGVKKPEYDCNNCHQPLTVPHLGGTCSDCHTPVGWKESAASVTVRAPQIAHPLENREDCWLCHDPAGQAMPAPAMHKDFNVNQCAMCHKIKQ